MSRKIFYLGPMASYCDCARMLFVEKMDLGDFEAIPVRSISAVINELAKEENFDSFAVLPIENSVEGVVRETLDNLCMLKNTSINIIAETSISVQHCLATFSESLGAITTVVSHPQAIAQCYGFINEKLTNDVSLNHESSTASAIKSLLMHLGN